MKLRFLTISILVSFISVYSLLHPGLIPTHDGEYHVIRFFEFYQTFSEGHVYPRWAPDLNFGMGVPLFNYVYPFPNFVSTFLHFLGISFIDSFKLNIVASTVVGAFFMFLLGKLFFGEVGGMISSIYYSFSPYRLVDIYVRGSVGELWALAFLPGLIWSLSRMKKDSNLINICLSALFISLIIFSHNILSLILISFSMIYVLVLNFQKVNKGKILLKSVFSYVLGLGISAIFWLPALYESKYVKGLEIFNYKEHFVDLANLLIPSWGTGFSGIGVFNQMSFQIGLANLFIIFLTIIIITRIKDKNRRIISFFIIFFFFLVFLMQKPSSFIWENVPLINYFQFPWRLLSLVIFICSFLSGFIGFVILNSKKINIYLKYSAVAFLLFIPVFSALSYIKPAFYHLRSDSYYTSRSNFMDGTNSPGNLFNTIWVKDLAKQKNLFEIIKGKGNISFDKINSEEFELKVNSDKNVVIRSSIVYFPGWTYLLNNKKSEIAYDNSGLIILNVPKGNNFLRLSFNNTFVRNFSTVISICSLIIIFLMLIPHRYNIMKKRL